MAEQSWRVWGAVPGEGLIYQDFPTGTIDQAAHQFRAQHPGAEIHEVTPVLEEEAPDAFNMGAEEPASEDPLPLPPDPDMRIRLSEEEKNKLIRLKGITGLGTWAAVMRWALALSLARKGRPSPAPPPDSNIEVSWSTFGGEYADLWGAALRHWMRKEDLPEKDPEEFYKWLRQHIYRGVKLMSAEVKTFPDLAELTLELTTSRFFPDPRMPLLLEYHPEE